jgi:two-component system sensor histidine kinase BaeS
VVARVTSLRLWLLVAMITSAIVGLGGFFLLERQLENSTEHSADTADAQREARAIAAQVMAGAGPTRLARLQDLLSDERLTVERAGATVFGGPPPPKGRRSQLQVRAPFPGGIVQLADYSPPDSGPTLELTLITAGVIALVIAAAILTATLVTRAVRGPVERAIDAAERLSHGELSARMGSSGPEELVKLGRAFDGMADRLERTDRDQRQFLADVAHEIATPLNTISGFGLALADGAVKGEAQRAEAKALIQTDTGRLLDLLSDLRELTRLDLAEGVRFAPVELAPFGRELVARFRPAATTAGLELHLRVRDGRIVSDSRLLDTVASNLLSNAIRYTPRGGRVEVDLRQHRDKTVLAVRDNGVGIAPENQQRIFERLYRVDGARDRASGGSGLGLPLAHRAAQSLGGHIELESTPGRGSEFRLILPSANARAARETEVSSSI